MFVSFIKPCSSLVVVLLDRRTHALQKKKKKDREGLNVSLQQAFAFNTLHVTNNAYLFKYVMHCHVPYITNSGAKSNAVDDSDEELLLQIFTGTRLRLAATMAIWRLSTCCI